MEGHFRYAPEPKIGDVVADRNKYGSRRFAGYDFRDHPSLDLLRATILYIGLLRTSGGPCRGGPPLRSEASRRGSPLRPWQINGHHPIGLGGAQLGKAGEAMWYSTWLAACISSERQHLMRLLLRAFGIIIEETGTKAGDKRRG
jgi:hypothetical protein